MQIRTDLTHQKLIRQIQKTQSQVLKEMKELSSGKRINSASDDSAGLQVSERLARRGKSLDASTGNIRMAYDLLRTGDGGMKAVQEALLRMKELAIQSANGIYTTDERQKMNGEFQLLAGTIDKLANTVTYNGVHVLNRSLVHSSPAVPAGTPETLEDVFQDVLVDASGNFQFRTLNGYDATPLDNNLNIAFTGGLTSRPSVQIGASNYELFWYRVGSTVRTGDDFVTRYRITMPMGFVTIDQTVRAIQDKIEIRYRIENQGVFDRLIGFQHHMDVQIGSDDQAPFIVNGTPVLPTGPERMYSGASVPAEFYTYNATVNPDILAHGILNGAGILVPPDVFGIGRYNVIRNPNWTPGPTIGDSGYIVRWNPRVLTGGESIEFNTFYGIDIPPTVTPPSGENDGMVRIHHSYEADAAHLFQMADMRSETLEIDALDILSEVSSEASIAQLNGAIQRVSREQTKFGSYMKRIESMEERNSGSELAMKQANQRIEEADIAGVSSKLAADQIKLSASFSLIKTNQTRFDGIIHLLNA